MFCTHRLFLLDPGVQGLHLGPRCLPLAEKDGLATLGTVAMNDSDLQSRCQKQATSQRTAMRAVFFIWATMAGKVAVRTRKVAAAIEPHLRTLSSVPTGAQHRAR